MDTEVIGNWIGNILGALIALGVTAAIFLFCWNYAIVNVTPLTPIKYYECFLVILAWRCMVYDPNKKN